MLAWTPAMPEGRGWAVPWGGAEPSTGMEGKKLLWANMLGNRGSSGGPCLPLGQICMVSYAGLGTA